MAKRLKSTKNPVKKNGTPVVILCGGRGTRLKEETEIIPKPLVKIGGYPILWHIMKTYRSHGFYNFILPIGYKGEKIKEYFLNYASLQSDFTVDFSRHERQVTYHSPMRDDWKVTIVDTGLTADTGARIKRVESYIKSKMFLLTYGDGVADVNVNAIVDFHRRNNRIATITGVHPPARFGEVMFKNEGQVTFKEKPQVVNTYINGGFFVFNQDIFKFLNDDEKLSFEKDVLPNVAQKNQLSVFKHDGYWQCMDTLRDVEFLNEEWSTGAAPWKVW